MEVGAAEMRAEPELRQRIKDAEEAERAHDRRPLLGSRFQGCCRTTRDGGGLPEGEGIPAGITHNLVLLIDLPARRMEREERLLAMHGGDVNKTLFDICEEGGGKDARFLLAHGADAEYVWRGWKLLERAAESGRLSVVEALLDAGADELGEPLWRAADGGQNAVVALLLDRGADVHSDDDYALGGAAANGHLQTATLLLDRGADPNAAHSPWGGGTALSEAREGGFHKMVALLLNRGVSVGAAPVVGRGVAGCSFCPAGPLPEFAELVAQFTPT